MQARQCEQDDLRTSYHPGRNRFTEHATGRHQQGRSTFLIALDGTVPDAGPRNAGALPRAQTAAPSERQSHGIGTTLIRAAEPPRHEAADLVKAI